MQVQVKREKENRTTHSRHSQLGGLEWIFLLLDGLVGRLRGGDLLLFVGSTVNTIWGMFRFQARR